MDAQHDRRRDRTQQNPRISMVDPIALHRNAFSKSNWACAVPRLRALEMQRGLGFFPSYMLQQIPTTATRRFSVP